MRLRVEKMIASLSFSIETGYLQTEFDQLRALGGSFFWTSSKTCLWTFSLEKIKQVEAVLGKPIEFGESSELVLARSPQSKEQVSVKPFKGESGLEIITLAKIYLIKEWRKVESSNGSITLKELKHELPLGNVEAMRVALSKIDQSNFKKGLIPSRRVAEEVCGVLELTRFNRQTGSFDWQKFLGARKDYHHYYYLPLKVLVHLKEIVHRKKGFILKLGVQKELV